MSITHSNTLRLEIILRYLRGVRLMRRKYFLVKIKKNKDDDGHISLHMRAKDKEMILDMFGNYYYTTSVQEIEE
jgi:hypothetical protein